VNLNLRLSDTAKGDIESIAVYTYENFGALALDRYLALIEKAFEILLENPTRPGVKPFEFGILKYHLLLAKTSVKGLSVNRPRHVVFFRVQQDGFLEILRVLHDSMDFDSHF
jgi:toxin ParE1/3/4